MQGSLDNQLGFAPDYDSTVPYMQRTRDYYTAIRLHDALSLGALCRCAVPTAEKALGAIARDDHYHRRPL
jgi:hypothetical protein